MRLTLEDCIAVGFCTKGQLRFCRAYGIDYRAFCRDGLPFERFDGIEDANLKRAMAQAVIREEGV